VLYLPPDYSYTTTLQDNLKHEQEKTELSRSYEPNPVDTSSVTLTPALEDFVKAYAESVHDQWSYAKVILSKRNRLSINKSISD